MMKMREAWDERRRREYESSEQSAILAEPKAPLSPLLALTPASRVFCVLKSYATFCFLSQQLTQDLKLSAVLSVNLHLPYN